MFIERFKKVAQTSYFFFAKIMENIYHALNPSSPPSSKSERFLHPFQVGQRVLRRIQI